MKAMASDWYKKIWTLDIQNHSWVEDTIRQVDFLVDKLKRVDLDVIRWSLRGAVMT